jgi:hypothetical protein
MQATLPQKIAAYRRPAKALLSAFPETPMLSGASLLRQRDPFHVVPSKNLARRVGSGRSTPIDIFKTPRMLATIPRLKRCLPRLSTLRATT